MDKTYRDFMEAKVKSWADMKDRNVLKAAEKFKKKMKKGNVLGFSLAHDEFVIFRNEVEWEFQGRNAKDMKWIRVE